MRTVLVTGCAGFIGNKTVELLLNDGVKVIGVDNIDDYYDIRLKEFRLNQLLSDENFIFKKFSIVDYNSLSAILSEHRIDAVINLAARAGVRYSIENPYIYFATNVNGLLSILELMKQYNVKKLVQASSSSVYAGEKMPYIETMSVNKPISPYASSKKASENLCYTYHKLYGLDISVLRYFTVYGPLGRPDMSPFRFLRWIDEGKPITLYGDGSQARDFTYIDDIAKGTIKALKPLSYEIINLGGGNNPYPINYMIKQFEKLLDKKAIIDNKPFQKSDMKTTWADITKAKGILDWQPTVSFDDGLRKMVDWYVENRNWVKDIKL